jgi:hypothetical protein
MPERSAQGYGAVAAIWECDAQGAPTFTVKENGYVRFGNDTGQKGAGCSDGSGHSAG